MYSATNITVTSGPKGVVTHKASVFTTNRYLIYLLAVIGLSAGGSTHLHTYNTYNTIRYCNLIKMQFFGGGLWRCDPTRVTASSFLRFLDHIHNNVPQSVGLLWTSDQLVAETSTWLHTTLTTDKHPCPWWDSNLWSQQASGRIPTP